MSPSISIFCSWFLASRTTCGVTIVDDRGGGSSGKCHVRMCVLRTRMAIPVQCTEYCTVHSPEWVSFGEERAHAGWKADDWHVAHRVSGGWRQANWVETFPCLPRLWSLFRFLSGFIDCHMSRVNLA
ncbi:hypothetical protein B0J13DRAFT_559349 [Dactylonectria estremocensis]|uniref:Secreted protein n=1 Tax=Dactylonectria estremocensis TaxID=1079267 RepID=A0A9P9ED84_9HYPO|nr:hypothetical protein B0J13DRAFT_559349 [Dactylonectria estremocensis]